MVGDHVAEGAGSFVIPAAMSHAHSFRDSDLNVIDEMTAPDGLEDAVTEPEDHDVLNRLFAEIVIDAVNLRLVKNLLDVLVELARGVQVVSEGLLDDHAGPAAVLFAGQVRLAQLADNLGKKTWRDGEIKEAVALGPALLVHLFDLTFQALVGRGVLKIPLDVVDPLEKPLPGFRIDGRGGHGLEIFCQLLPERLGGESVGGKSDDGEFAREKIPLRQVAERGDELTFGQVSGGAENDHDARISSRTAGRSDWRRHHLPRRNLISCRALDVAAELIAHGREHFCGEVVLASRGEALIKRRGEHGGGSRRFDGREDGPSPLARIGNMARKLFEVGLLEQGDGGKVE